MCNRPFQQHRNSELNYVTYITTAIKHFGLKMFVVMRLQFAKPFAKSCLAASLGDPAERNQSTASLTAKRSDLTSLGSPSLSENKAKESGKRSKDPSPVIGKKSSILSSLGHKLTKSKPKDVPSGSLHIPPADLSASNSIEDGFVVVKHASNVDGNQGKPGFNGLIKKG